MDGLSLYKICRILNEKFVDYRLNGIAVVNENFILNLYNKGNIQLCFQADALSWIYFGNLFPNAGNNLKLPLSGSVIKGFKTKSFDRILFIDLSKRKPSGKLVEYRIIFEAVGRNSNIFVVNEENKIIFNLNRRNIDVDRNINIGVKYQPFKCNKRYDLLNIGAAESFDELIGFYPLTVKYADLVTKDCVHFKDKVEKLLYLINKDDYFYSELKGKWLPFEIPGYSDKKKFHQIEFKLSEDFNSSVLKTRKAKLRKYYEKKLEKYEYLKNKLKKELECACEYNNIEKQAVLLKSNLHILNNKSGKVMLFDYSDGDIREIPFDIEYGVNYDAEVNKLFKKSQKLKRSISLIEKRIEEINGYILSVVEDLLFLESADEDEINEMFFNVFSNRKKIKKQRNKNKFYTFKFKDSEYYVGRNSIVNHELVFGFANPDDIWFHAQKIPSAHVILRNKKEITDDDILFGARLTAHYSKHLQEKKVTVDYTLKKFVKHPKNSPTGFVTYSNFKSLRISPLTEFEIDQYRNC